MKRPYGHIIINAILAAAVVVTLAIRYAEPVTDGDIWFHMTYGRYMLENRTLAPDHAAFSWTKADNSAVYCAWIPQILFYELYKAGGMPALFALRYAAIAAFLAMALMLAYPLLRAGPSLFPLVLLVCLTGLLMSQAGLLIKAEIFSFLFMGMAAFLWFMVKENVHHSRAMILGIPLLMLVWVNSHGGFLFGAVFLACAAAGEAINQIVKSPRRLPDNLIVTAAAALGLSMLALVVTPYGWDYLAYLRETLGSPTFARQTLSVRAYHSILSPEVKGTHFLEYLLVSLAVMAFAAGAAMKRRCLDWSIITVSVPFILLFFKYIRATYFWGVLFVFASLALLRRIAERPLELPGYVKVSAQALIIALVLFFSARMSLESLYSPNVGLQALHFSDPVEEAQFVKNNLKGLTMGNNYNCGSYLMWSLWPQHKVFMDERYFPYVSWYAQYNEFEYGPDDNRRLAFLNEHPCDFWFLTYDFPHLDLFLRSPEWRLLHYGPKACVFVSYRYATRQAPPSVSGGVYKAGFYTSIAAADFARAAGDIHVAKKILDRLKPAPFWPEQSRRLGSSLESLGAAFAKNGRIDEAVALLRKALDLNPGSARAHLFLGNTLNLAGRIAEARAHYEEALRIEPDNIHARKALAFLANRTPQAPAPAQGDDPASLERLARSYAESGDYEKALEALLRLDELQPGNADTLYNTACVLARLGRTGEALDRLEAAVSRGFDRWDVLKQDPDLAPLRSTARYKKLTSGR